EMERSVDMGAGVFEDGQLVKLVAVLGELDGPFVLDPRVAVEGREGGIIGMGKVDDLARGLGEDLAWRACRDHGGSPGEGRSLEQRPARQHVPLHVFDDAVIAHWNSPLLWLCAA